jgi:hypothetical protein
MSLQNPAVNKRDDAYQSLVNGLQGSSTTQLVVEALLQLVNGPLAQHAFTRLSLHWQVTMLGPPPVCSVEEQIKKHGGVVYFLSSGWSWIPFELIMSRLCGEVVATVTMSTLNMIESYLGKGNFMANLVSVSVANFLALAPTYPFLNLKVSTYASRTHHLQIPSLPIPYQDQEPARTSHSLRDCSR